MKDGRLYQIKKTNDGRKINMGRFNSRMFKETLERAENEDWGLCILAYEKDPNLPHMIFFGENKNIIRGVENLNKVGVVYVNIHQKKRGEWIMKISPLGR